MNTEHPLKYRITEIRHGGFTLCLAMCAAEHLKRSHVPAEKIMEDLRIIKCVLEKKYDESVIKGRFHVVG